MSNASALVDFDRIFRHPWFLNAGDTDDKQSPRFWEERAAAFARKAHGPQARAENELLLQRFSWDPEETVLDVGAGPGSFAIPLATRVKSVTAVDFSEGMLRELRAQAAQERVENIVVRQSRWLSLADIEPHDTVLAMNSLGVLAQTESGATALDTALDRMRDAARRRVIILIPHADSPADQAMKQALGLPEYNLEQERIALLFHALVHRGMMPNVQILERPFRWTFANLEEAVEALASRLQLTSILAKGMLGQHLQDRLTPLGDEWGLAYPVRQALFWWERPS